MAQRIAERIAKLFGGFTTGLVTRETGEHRRGRPVEVLVQPLRFGVYAGDTRAHRIVDVTVPAGTRIDGASTPRLLWPIFPPFGPWKRAAVLHDYLYSRPEVPRWLADALFRAAMFYDNVPWWRRVVAFWGVRAFGASHRTKNGRTKECGACSAS